MDYFSQVPLVEYGNLETANSTVVLTNLMTRSAFLKEIVENTSLFYDYEVKDGETSEIIADKLYGSADRAWIVLLFNNLMNPYYDFPLISEQLNDLVESEYGTTVAVAQSTIHHYEERIRKTTYYFDMPQSVHEDRYVVSATYQNPNTGIVEARPYLPTLGSITVGPSYTEDFGSGVTVTVESTYHAISNYDYELEENEKRRKIKLLDKQYVISVENEFRRLMRNGN